MIKERIKGLIYLTVAAFFAGILIAAAVVKQVPARNVYVVDRGPIEYILDEELDQCFVKAGGDIEHMSGRQCYELMMEMSRRGYFKK